MDDETRDCAPKLALSMEEEQILRRMRELRATYRALCKRQVDPARLEELKQEFRVCREELEQANRTKWIRLGYEP